MIKNYFTISFSVINYRKYLGELKSALFINTTYKRISEIKSISLNHNYKTKNLNKLKNKLKKKLT